MKEVDFSSYIYYDFANRKPFISCRFFRVHYSQKENVLKFFSGQRFEAICALIFSLTEINIEVIVLNQTLDLIRIHNLFDETITELYAKKRLHLK